MSDVSRPVLELMRRRAGSDEEAADSPAQQGMACELLLLVGIRHEVREERAANRYRWTRARPRRSAFLGLPGSTPTTATSGTSALVSEQFAEQIEALEAEAAGSRPDSTRPGERLPRHSRPRRGSDGARADSEALLRRGPDQEFRTVHPFVFEWTGSGSRFRATPLAGITSTARRRGTARGGAPPADRR